MPGMRRKVTFIKLMFFRIERRREEKCSLAGVMQSLFFVPIGKSKMATAKTRDQKGCFK